MIGILSSWAVALGLLSAVAAGCVSDAAPQDRRDLLESFRTRDFLIRVLPTGRLPKGAAFSPDGRWLFVSNMEEPSVTVIGAGALSAADTPSIRTLETPRSPTGIPGNIEVTFTPDGRYALVSRADPGDPFPRSGLVSVIRLATLETVKYLPTGTPRGQGGQGSKVIAVSPGVDAQGRRVAYVSNYFSHDISILDVTEARLAEGPLADPALLVGVVRLRSSRGSAISPRGIAFTPDARYALVTGYTSSTLFVMDAQTHRQIGELPRAGRSMRHIVMTDDGRVAFISHMGSNEIARIHVPRLLDEVARARTGLGAGAVAFLNPGVWERIRIPWADGRATLSVADYPPDYDALNAARGFPRDGTILPTGQRQQPYRWAHPNTIALDPRPGNRYLYVSFRTSHPQYPSGNFHFDRLGKVDIIDTFQGRVVFRLVGGREPTGLSVSPDGRTLASTAFRDNTVHLFDVGRLLERYEAAGRP